MTRTNYIRKIHLLSYSILGASLFCAMSANIAHAAGAAADAPAGSTVASVSEIVVTATRREEKLQNVGITITALSKDELAIQKVQDFKDVALRVPGMSFIPLKGAAYASPQIRGQVTVNESPGLDAPIATYIDDIYYGSAASFGGDFFDVDQIAVLKGPQGTTFGRNVVGGAIQITNALPQLRVNAGKATLTAGNYDDLEATGFFNKRVGENSALRLSYSAKRRSGFNHNVFTGVDVDNLNVTSARLQYRFQPTDKLDINFSASTMHQDQFGPGVRLVGATSIGAIALQNSKAPGPWTSYVNDNGKSKRNVSAIVLHVNYESPIGTISSITGARDLYSTYWEDQDTLPITIYGNPHAVNVSKESLISQELRIVSPADRRISYIAGIYGDAQRIEKYLDLSFNFPSVAGTGQCPISYNPSSVDPTINPTGNFYISCAARSQVNNANGFAFFASNVTSANYVQTVDVESVAPYAEIKWNVNNTLAVTAGARYTYIKKNGRTVHNNASPFYGAAYDAPFSKDWTSFTPRFLITYKPNEQVLLYASASSGFKSGGFSATVGTKALAQTPLAPEKSISYEAGLKTQLFDRKLIVDLAIYRATTKNLQTKTLQGGFFVERNAGEAEARGGELELRFQPTRWDPLESTCRHASLSIL